MQNAGSVQKSLELARLNREAMGEPQMGGYRAGSPSRFAGVEISKRIGGQGDFAGDTNDPANQKYFSDYVGRLGSFGAISGDQGGMA